MDAAAEDGVLDVDILADEGSDDEGDAPPSSGEPFYNIAMISALHI